MMVYYTIILYVYMHIVSNASVHTPTTQFVSAVVSTIVLWFIKCTVISS